MLLLAQAKMVSSVKDAKINNSMKIYVVCAKKYLFLWDNIIEVMRRTLLFAAAMMLSVFGMAQTAETIDVSKSPDGPFTINTAELEITGQVVNGKKEGTWMETFVKDDNFLPHRVIHFKNDKKNGLYIEIDKTGAITKKADYKDDQPNGVSCQWYRGGRLFKKDSYKEGILDGEQIQCYEQGGRQEVATYKDGKREGQTTWYDQDGNMMMTIDYKNGQFDGEQKTYYINGVMKSSKTFKNNKQEGPAKEFYENGSLKSETNYRNGELQGKERNYKKKGGDNAEEKTPANSKK